MQQLTLGTVVTIDIGNPIFSNSEDGSVQVWDSLPHLVGKEATIVVSYNQLYGKGKPFGLTDKYTLDIDGFRHSWFHRNQFTVKTTSDGTNPKTQAPA